MAKKETTTREKRLSETLTELASAIRHEHLWFEDVRQLWKDTIKYPLAPAKQKGLNGMIKRAGEIRSRRVEEIRTLADDAPQDAKAAILKAGLKLEGGKDVADDLLDVVAMLVVLPLPQQREYTKSEIAEMTELGDTAITKYTRRAKVAVPPPGAKNHRYTQDETERILIAIRDA